jgi:hypothetical protein
VYIVDCRSPRWERGPKRGGGQAASQAESQSSLVRQARCRGRVASLRRARFSLLGESITAMMGRWQRRQGGVASHREGSGNGGIGTD